MADISYMGNNVWTIYHLPMNDYYGLDRDKVSNFKKSLKNLPYKYVTAITANSCQRKAANILKENKFKPVISFYSSHGRHENLTLWVRIQKNKPNTPKKTQIGKFPSNCSVSYNYSLVKAFSLVSGTRKQIEKYSGRFVRVPKTPIWYGVKVRNVASNKYTPASKIKIKNKYAVPMENTGNIF